VPELLAAMSARELMQWWVFNSINPIGMERADLRAAFITASIRNALGDKCKPADFLLAKQPPKFETVQDLHDAMEQWVRMSGGVVIDPNEEQDGD
jgi:hypothetical protein